MSIAQPDVAREGDVYPRALTSIDPRALTSIDGSQFESLTCDHRNLPYQTLRAYQRALTISGLSQRARCALAALAQTVDRHKPLASIFAHRDYLSARSGLSERTWYRAEQDLVEAGLITIAQQARKRRHGRFGAAYIYLSEAAATLLGLLGKETALRQRAPKGPRRGPGPASDSSEISAGTSDRVKVGLDAEDLSAHDTTTDSHVSPSANLAAQYTNVYRSPTSFQKRQQARLPSDVQPLVSLGFHENYIFKLMKLARVEHKKRLGDVVQSCWDSLKKAKRPIPYLRTLLRSSTDFVWLANQQRIALAAAAKLAQAQAELKRASLEIAGRTFVSSGGDVQYRVSTSGQILTSYDAREGRERIATTGWLPGFIQAIRAGAVMVPDVFEVQNLPTKRRVRQGLSVNEPNVDRKKGTSYASIAQMRAQLRAISAEFGGLRAVA